MTSNTRIYKYRLRDQTGPQEIQMSLHAKVLHVGWQDGAPHVWAEVDTGDPYMYHTFRIYQTGDIVEPGGKFLGTILVSDTYVLHVYRY